MDCAHCHSEVKPGWKACPACAKALPQTRVCPTCSKELSKEMRFCPYCGTPLRPNSIRGLGVERSIQLDEGVLIDKSTTNIFYAGDRSVLTEEIVDSFRAIEDSVELDSEYRVLMNLVKKLDNGSLLLSDYDPKTWATCLEEVNNLMDLRLDELLKDRGLIDKFKAVVLYIKCAALIALGRNAEALECSDGMLNTGVYSGPAWYIKGLVLLQFDKYAQVISCLTKSLEIDPEQGIVWTVKGDVISRQLKRLIVKLTSNEVPAGEFISKYEKLKQEAMECFMQALELNSRIEEAWLGRATLEENQDEQMRCIDRVLELNFKSPNAWYMKGVFTQNQFIVDLAEAADTDNISGILRRHESELWESVKCFDNALSADPHFTDALKQKDSALKMLGAA